jgi:hypothetical protein
MQACVIWFYICMFSLTSSTVSSMEMAHVKEIFPNDEKHGAHKSVFKYVGLSDLLPNALPDPPDEPEEEEGEVKQEASNHESNDKSSICSSGSNCTTNTEGAGAITENSAVGFIPQLQNEEVKEEAKACNDAVTGIKWGLSLG